MVQLAIGSYQVIFGFDEQGAVSVEGQFVYISSSEVVEWRPGEIYAAAKAVSLLGHRVASAQQTAEGDLRILFTNGDILAIAKVSGGFESYQVTGKGATIVV